MSSVLRSLGLEDASDEQRTDAGASAESERSTHKLSFRLARLLFGGTLVFTGLNHFRDTESMVAYAESKGIPAADVMVPFSGGMLAFAGAGIALWRLPVLAAGAAVTFFLGVTPSMHDFWNADEDQKQSQMNDFLKNVGLLGGALAFLVRGGRE
jgi:uncharacterized membrane protein YphA (DoxX/SURF4 family)